MTKKQIRQNMISKMKSFDASSKKTADLWLKGQLFQQEVFQKAQKISIVLSMPHEVNTYDIIETAIKMGKQIYVPHTDYNENHMTFKQLLSLNDISKDAKGINYSTSDTATTNELDLIIVPGVAFNKDGYRIGYGGGYYDRFLSEHPSHTISLVYDFQIVNFATDYYDQAVDQLIIYTT